MGVVQKTKGNEIESSAINQPINSIGSFRDNTINIPINVYLFRVSLEENQIYKYNSCLFSKYFKTRVKSSSSERKFTTTLFKNNSNSTIAKFCFP